MVAGTAVIAVVGVDWAGDWLAELASDLLGWEIALDHLAVDWSATPRVTIHGLTIANADWGSHPDLATIEQLGESYPIELNLDEALAVYMGEDVPVPGRCLVTDLVIDSGVIKPRNLLLDTATP
jgi:hypothetical protein